MKELETLTTVIERNNEEIEIEIEGWVVFEIDRSYGADADGNRGSKRNEVKEVIDLNVFDSAGGDEIKYSREEQEIFEDTLIKKFLDG